MRNKATFVCVLVIKRYSDEDTEVFFVHFTPLSIVFNILNKDLNLEKELKLVFAIVVRKHGIALVIHQMKKTRSKLNKTLLTK